MGFSDLQIRLLRSRLSAYRNQEGQKQRGRPLPWLTVAGQIERKLELKFDVGGKDGERLRQFVQGVPVTRGSKEMRPRILEDHRLQAVRDFLLHNDVRYLSEEELAEGTGVHAAAFTMAEFMAETGEPSPVHHLTPEQVAGSYQNTVKNGVSYKARRLSFKHLSDGLLEVEGAEEIYDAAQIASEFSQWREPEKYRRRRLCRKSSGWAVKNGNDCLFVYLKDNADSSLSSYITAARQKPEADGMPVKWLLLQQYGPAAYLSMSKGEQGEVREITVSKLNDQYLLQFERVE